LTVGDYAELDLLQTLERGLSAAYTLFHSVDWVRASGEWEQHGEIDIVVVNQGGGPAPGVAAAQSHACGDRARNRGRPAYVHT